MEPLVNQNKQTDAQLVKLAQQGQQEAFVTLYRRYLPKVYRRVRFQVHANEVEDVTQEVFISVMNSLDSFKGDSKFSTWLYTLTRNRIVDHYRKRRVEQVELENAEYQVSEEKVDLDQQIIVKDAMKRLPQDYQDIILMRFAEGLRFQDIAEARDQSLEAAKSMFRRAMTALKQEVRQLDATE